MQSLDKCIGIMHMQSYAARIKTEQLYVRIDRVRHFNHPGLGLGLGMYLIIGNKCAVPDADRSMPEKDHEDSVTTHVRSDAPNCVLQSSKQTALCLRWNEIVTFRSLRQPSFCR